MLEAYNAIKRQMNTSLVITYLLLHYVTIHTLLITTVTKISENVAEAALMAVRRGKTTL